MKRVNIYLREEDLDRLARLQAGFGLGASAACRAGLGVLETQLAEAGSLERDLQAVCEEVLRLWQIHGLGDDDRESEPVYNRLVAVVRRANDARFMLKDRR